MRVPRLNLGNFTTLGYQTASKTRMQSPMIKPLKNDEVSFSSTAWYLKKYKTLPDEIKKNLSPEDAIDMFKDMERVARKSSKQRNIGEGTHSTVYSTPWLKDYYLLVLSDTNYDKHTVYAPCALGDAVWCDIDDPRIQIINKSA